MAHKRYNMSSLGSRNVFETFALLYYYHTFRKNGKLMITSGRKTAKETVLRAIRTDAQLRGGWLLGARGLWIPSALCDLVLCLLNLLAPFYGGKTAMYPFPSPL